MSIKKCAKCKEEKPVEEFAESTRSADGRASVCNECKEVQEAPVPAAPVPAAPVPVETPQVAPFPTTNSVTPEEEERLIAEMLGDIEREKDAEKAANILPPKKEPLLRGPDGFLYVWTPILAAKPGMVEVER